MAWSRRLGPMTVRVAAPCVDDGESSTIVIATDTELSQQFTHSELHTKHERIAHNWLAMLSADDLSHAEALIGEAQAELTACDTTDFSTVLGALDTARKRLA